MCVCVSVRVRVCVCLCLSTAQIKAYINVYVSICDAAKERVKGFVIALVGIVDLPICIITCKCSSMHIQLRMLLYIVARPLAPV